MLSEAAAKGWTTTASRSPSWLDAVSTQPALLELDEGFMSGRKTASGKFFWTASLQANLHQGDRAVGSKTAVGSEEAGYLAYANSNPLTGTDPSGLAPTGWICDRDGCDPITHPPRVPLGGQYTRSPFDIGELRTIIAGQGPLMTARPTPSIPTANSGACAYDAVDAFDETLTFNTCATTDGMMAAMKCKTLHGSSDPGSEFCFACTGQDTLDNPHEDFAQCYAFKCKPFCRDIGMSNTMHDDSCVVAPSTAHGPKLYEGIGINFKGCTGGLAF
jgi:hypothetical protein